LRDGGLRVSVDLLTTENGPGGVSSRRIADAGGVIADDEHRLMSEFLELADDFQRDDMAKRDIRCRGVHTELNAQRFAGFFRRLNLSAEIVLREDSLAAAREKADLVVDRYGHKRVGF